MFFSLKADTTANDKEATAYQSGAVEDQMGPAPHHTEAAADLAKAATDQTGAAADQIGAPAVQTEASADQAALVDHLLKNTSSFDGKESFQDLKDKNLSITNDNKVHPHLNKNLNHRGISLKLVINNSSFRVFTSITHGKRQFYTTLLLALST